MARQVTPGMARSMRSHPALRPGESAARPERRRGRIAYIAGFGFFALGFVGMAVSVTVGSQLLVIVCIAVVVLGGVAAGIGFHQMYVEELREFFVVPDSGDQDDDGGGGGRRPGPEETPPFSGGTPPGEEDQPSWWPAFDQALKEWMLEGATGPVAPEGLAEP